MYRFRLNIILLISSACLFSSSFLQLSGQDKPGPAPDTIFISRSDSLISFVTPRYQYCQTLTMKLFMSQALFDGKHKRRDNGKSEVFLNCEKALEIIRRIDNLTLGIPKIIYLVGWQYNGHDSKYPAWFEANEKIKRPIDLSAFESLKWLMKEAEKYHTIISLHINMLDAYEDSPLWELYLKNNIIARNKDSTLRPGEWGYPVSYAQEWKTGYARKRIDTLCRLLPLEKAGTIHIDAFHSWPPIPVLKENGEDSIDLSKGVISPFLNYSVSDETEAQRQIFRYWASKGIDVTSEGVDFLRETAFEGYQHMAWWFGGKPDYYLKWSASYYCGGMDRSDWGKLFGTSMHGEDIVKKDPEKLGGFKEDFCLKTTIWYYLNRLDRIYLVNGKDFRSAGFSENVNVFLSDREYRITRGEKIIAENTDLFIPALWMGNNRIICYSRNGYKNRRWELPDGWSDAASVKLYRVTDMGIKEIGLASISNGVISLSMKKDEMILIEKEERKNTNILRRIYVSSENR
jgi:hypothetical protein